MKATEAKFAGRVSGFSRNPTTALTRSTRLQAISGPSGIVTGSAGGEVYRGGLIGDRGGLDADRGELPPAVQAAIANLDKRPHKQRLRKVIEVLCGLRDWTTLAELSRWLNFQLGNLKNPCQATGTGIKEIKRRRRRMTERKMLLESIAHTTADYRKGEIDAPTPVHIERWVAQFDPLVQLPMLREMAFVLERTYFSLERVTAFLRGLVGIEKLTGKEPCGFWRGVNFLDIQSGGNSQTEMLELFNKVLQEKCGFGIRQCGGDGSVFLYLDDAIFTGNRVRRDLEAWVKDKAPNKAVLHIVSIALHSGARHYAGGYITKAAAASGKLIDVTWWRAIELEDRKSHSDTADVLRPTHIPDDPNVQAYVQAMKYPPTLRRSASMGANALFASDAGRSLLEQEFLKAGARIRQLCANLGATQRPLGHITLDTLGFGSLVVTFRNCPNNAPLALWVGAPWYPLFPRTTNNQTAIKRLFADLTKGGADVR